MNWSLKSFLAKLIINEDRDLKQECIEAVILATRESLHSDNDSISRAIDDISYMIGHAAADRLYGEVSTEPVNITEEPITTAKVIEPTYTLTEVAEMFQSAAICMENGCSGHGSCIDCWKDVIKNRIGSDGKFTAYIRPYQRWHDIKNNPNILPLDDHAVLVTDGDSFYRGRCMHSKNGNRFWVSKIKATDIVAWKEVDIRCEFENEHIKLWEEE